MQSTVAGSAEHSVLVTGGAGFIGSHVVDLLLSEKRRVVVLDDLSSGNLQNLNSSAEFVRGSILDEELVERLFVKHRFRHVYHLAGFAAERLSHSVRRHNYQLNVVGSAILINASIRHDVECFVYTSSAAVYGSLSGRATEDSPLEPIDPYGIAKWAVERDLRAAASRFGLAYVIFRAHNVYGERQDILDHNRNVVGIFIRSVLEGRPLPIHGDGSQTRPFSHVSAVAPVIARAPFVPAARNQTFNVGADEPVRIRRLAEIVCESMGEPLRVHSVESIGEVKDVLCSHEKVRRVFALSGGGIGLEEGVRKMAAWARRMPVTKGPFQPAIETQRAGRE